MRRIAPAALAVFAAACASSTSLPGPNANPQPTIVESSTSTTVRVSTDNTIPVENVRASVDQAWAALPAVYQELGIAVGLSDPEHRAFGNRRLAVNRVDGEPVEQFVRCGNSGSGPSAMTRYRYLLTVVTTLQPGTAGTAVATQVNGSATPVEGTSGSAVLCVSNGKLELRVAELLRRRTGG